MFETAGARSPGVVRRQRDTKRIRAGSGRAQFAGMRIDDTVLYEEFVAARLRAVELTDAYREMPTDDPCRPLLWDGVVRQTEHARCLLEAWLRWAPHESESRQNSAEIAQKSSK